LWAQDFERDLADTMALQSEMAQTIAHQIRVEMTSDDEDQAFPRSPGKCEGHDSICRVATGGTRRQNKALVKASHFISRPSRRTPEYALAYAGLADSYIVLENNGQLPPAKLIQK
jgi:hypothetical protein